MAEQIGTDQSRITCDETLSDDWRSKSLRHYTFLRFGETPPWLLDELDASADEPRTRNTIQTDIAERRRAVVAELRTRGLSIREILDALAKSGCLNPYTGNPWSHGTVVNDLAALRKQWRETYQRTTANHIGEMLTQLEITETIAWSDGDFNRILNVIDRKRRLLRLDGNVTEFNRDAFVRAAKRYGWKYGISVEKLLERADRIMDADGPHRWTPEDIERSETDD